MAPRIADRRTPPPRRIARPRVPAPQPTQLRFEPTSLIVTAFAPARATLRLMPPQGQLAGQRDEDDPGVAVFDIVEPRVQLRGQGARPTDERHVEVRGTLVIVGAPPDLGPAWDEPLAATVVFDTPDGVKRGRGLVTLNVRSASVHLSATLADGRVLRLDAHCICLDEGSHRLRV